MRRAFQRRNNKNILEVYWKRFLDGAVSRGVSPEIAARIFSKFNVHDRTAAHAEGLRRGIIHIG